MSKHLRIRRVFKPFLCLVVLGGFLMYGYICREKKLPPHSLLDAAYHWAKDQKTLRSFYYLFRSKPDRRAMHGRWGLAKSRGEGEALTEAQRETMARLEAIGYLNGYEKAGGLENVTVHSPSKACNGLNLYTSGHGEEAILMDMKGAVLHKWSYDYEKAFPGRKLSPNLMFWRRVHLYPNGDLLAIYEGAGLIKLDKDSNLIWSLPAGTHHDFFVDERGIIFALSRETKVLPRIHKHVPVLEDFIILIDHNGKVIKKLSLLEAFEKSSFASFLDTMPEYGDLFHTNTIEVFDGAHDHVSPLFRKGNILISVLKLNLIAVISPEKEKVIWALSGQWLAQHQPTLLANGNILLLDNRGHKGMSKVIEFNPFTQAIAWAYEGTKKNGFFTDSCGSNQRLPNGNTLITESDSGKAFEVTPGKEIVWMFYNPARAGDQNELIATLFEIIRLDKDFPTDWL